jgi:deoxyribonucleoside regulator
MVECKNINVAAKICYNPDTRSSEGEVALVPTEHNGTRSDLDLLVQAAESYYIENKTQAQIAQQLGISSSTISRLLSRARDEGIVRINIIRPQARRTSLECTLRQRFALDEAIVVDVPRDASSDEAVRRIIGTVSAPYIDEMIEPGMVIGIGRGRTLAALADALQPLAAPRHITIVQVMGEYDIQHSPTRSPEITRQIAEIYTGASYYLNAPALVNDASLAEALMYTPGISQVLPFYDRLDMVLVGVGPLRGSPLDLSGLLRSDQIAQLEAAGAVGDICGHFFADDGRLLDDAYSGHAIGISWEQLRRCPCVVAIAAGDNKVKALRALLKAQLLHVLVTDERTAQQIVDAQ